MVGGGRVKQRAALLTAKDAAFLERIYDIDSKAGLYLEGGDRPRARRLFSLGMVRAGRLDPKRYALLTDKGEAFVERKRGLR
jgi:hypothetical protein